MKTKKQTQKSKTFLTGFTPSTDVEILQRLEATKALLQSITDIKDVKTIIPDLEKWEQNEIEMKYSCEVIAISNLVRDCTARLKDKYYQETGLYLPPIQQGSSLGVRVGWLRFVDIHLFGKESQTKWENIAASVSRDSAMILTGKKKINPKPPTMKKIVETLFVGDENIPVGKCLEKTMAKLKEQGITGNEQSIRNAYNKEKKRLKNLQK